MTSTPITLSSPSPLRSSSGSGSVPAKDQEVLDRALRSLLEKTTIALYGETGSGKTTQLFELAKLVGRLLRKRSRLYFVDNGSYDSGKHLIDGGLVELEVCGPKDDAFEWLNHATQGHIRHQGKWALDLTPGAYLFDGMTGAGESVMEALATSLEKGIHLGGNLGTKEADSMVATIGRGADAFKVGGNTEAHYGFAQRTLRRFMWASQALPGTVVWTADVAASTDAERQTQLSPRTPGKAMNTTIPRWFAYTMRLASEALPNARPRHVLYLEEYKDGLNQGYGNARLPLRASLKSSKIEPASIVVALEAITAARLEAVRADLEELAPLLQALGKEQG